MIFSHCSKELGHHLLLQELNAEPLLNLDLRLGEGSGCPLALPLLQSALAFYNEMASFDQANVSEVN
ncbi:MAG: nicotinate-nucleotide--dimethylbenzimidazole phosphoribosyltransferase, partial [Gammaproteobacteria bacterium]|nr:nicotinate-nucleotide--dimethylbenzimidazole phosphoribosyltransferase [Gammaproteobacteria bacterium]